MKKIAGTLLPSLPVALEHVRDLEYFDGPLLSEFRGPGDAVFLYHWCDTDGQVNRWLVVPIRRHELTAYLAQETPLQSLIYKDGEYLFVVDIDGQLKHSSVWLLQSRDLPADYIPAGDSFFTDRITPEVGVEEVYIADDSILKDPSRFPKKYREAYSFLAWFGIGEDPPAGSIAYEFTQGYVFRTAFETMSRLIPIHRQAKLMAIAAASPGYMRLAVDPGLAWRLRACLAYYSLNRESIRDSLTYLREFEDVLYFYYEDESEKNPHVERFNNLGVDYKKLRLRVNTSKDAYKLLTSFVNKLEEIYRQHIRGHLKIIGLDL
jgi:hypothetical protein